jgi:hypothetical protein
MATTKYIQGARVCFDIDTTELGTIDGLKVEIAQNKITKHIFIYPYPDEPSDIEHEFSIEGVIYSAILTSAMTAIMKGLYSIEITKFSGTTELDKGSSPFIIIEEENQ